MVERSKTITVRVRIAGEEHSVKGKATEKYIKELADIVDTKIKQIQKHNPNLTRHRTAILAAINLADELQKVKAEYQELLQIMEEAN
ncbi:MAG: cell division protein ZapA [Firmicutes bacterium]|nr:cell division protein ZapA [Bacillota bacterium]